MSALSKRAYLNLAPSFAAPVHAAANNVSLHYGFSVMIRLLEPLKIKLPREVTPRPQSLLVVHSHFPAPL